MTITRIALTALLFAFAGDVVAAKPDTVALKQYCPSDTQTSQHYLTWDCEPSTPETLEALERAIGSEFKRVHDSPDLRAYIRDPAAGFVGWVVTPTWAARYRARRDAQGITTGGGLTVFCAGGRDDCAACTTFAHENVPPQFVDFLLPEPPLPVF
jgi:hypothetical protein